MSKKQLRKQINKITHQQKLSSKSKKLTPNIAALNHQYDYYDNYYEDIEYLRHAAQDAATEHNMGGYSSFFRNL